MAVFPSQPVTGLKLADRPECGLRCWDAKIRHVTVDRLHVDVTRDGWMLEKRGEFRPKDQIAIRLMRIQDRFFTDAITSDKKCFFNFVPDRECEHPAEILQTIDAELVIK